VKLEQFADVAAGDVSKLSTGYATVGSTGSAVEVGVYAVGSGLKQLDPYGHFYIYCHWENARATPDQPAFTLIYAGSDGTLQTKCGGVKQKGDDQILTVNVAEAIQRTAVW